MVWEFISLAVMVCAPLNLSRRLKTHLRHARGKPPEHPPLPEPRPWTQQRDMSPFFSWQALDGDLWHDRRADLSRDVWLDQRAQIDSPRPRYAPAAIPERRDYILRTYDARYSFGAPLQK